MKFIMRKFCLFFISACVCANLLFAQKGLEWVSFWERSILDSTMNLHYTHNEHYIKDASYIHLNQFHPMFPLNHRILSSDGHVVAALKFIPPITSTDSERLVDRNNQHLLLSKNWISYFIREEKENDWRNYIRYYSEPVLKKKTNADTINIISLPPMYDKYYVDSYPYCTILILQKENRGCFPIFFMYDEIGKKDIETHITAIASSFRYGEDSPLLEELNNKNITTISPPQQKKGNIVRK